jgi:AcrR family transcriptional regulator
MDTRTTRPLTRRQTAKAVTRQKVMDAARQSFIEHGYLHATIRDIASACGMSTGAFFASFTSKEACLEAIIAEEHAEEFQLFDATRGISRSVTETIRGMLSLSYKRWSGEHGLLRAWMTQYWVGHSDLEELTRQYEKHVSDVVKKILHNGELHDIGRCANLIASLHMDNLRYLGVEAGNDPGRAEVRLGIQLELLITHGQHLGPGCA